MLPSGRSAFCRLLVLSLFVFPSLLMAQPEADADENASESSTEAAGPLMPPSRAMEFQIIRVLGRRESDQNRASGAAHSIGESTLDRDEYSDIHRVLGHVPGVYIRGEEGYGLRPNIGIRGATTERSQKIALMEDGVLIGPAPYSAPAAYYFPLVSRMTAVEVVKGPAAIDHGPNTVGGAINLVTRPVPEDRRSGVEVAAGNDAYARTHLFTADGRGNIGWLVEGLRLQTDGFKELDNGGDTGFEQNNLMVRFQSRPDWGHAGRHRFDLKLNYANEVSDETYLGLSDDDFALTPNRRYAGSARDRMDWTHRQIQLRHGMQPGEGSSLETVIYNHDFERDWFKLNGFDTDRTLAEILANPDAGLNRNFMEVLRGERDSSVDDETLLLGSNDRSYYSRGLQTVWRQESEWFGRPNDWRIGVRLHQDEVRRIHTEDGYVMQNGQLLNDGDAAVETVRNRESATALSLWFHDEIQLGDLRLNGGLRLESIRYRSNDGGSVAHNDNSVLLPGVGAFYSLSDELGVFAGIHRGFVPTGPREPDSIEPEQSINYEFGLRYQSGERRVEVVSYFNDYSNLKGTCAFSSGCDDAARGEAYSGGAVNVYGLELMLAERLRLPNGWELPMELSYTWTETEFQTTFDSGFPLWGNVEVGDSLPYMPQHQAGLRLGLDAGPWDMTFNTRYVGEQQEQAGRGGPLEGAVVESHVVSDLVARWFVNSANTVYFKVDNLADESYLLSRRPYGARPGKPRSLELGYKYRF